MRSFLLAAALALSACATSAGPTSRADFGALIAAALPAGEVVEVSGPGTWTPNSRRLVEFVNNGNLLPSAAPWKDGVTLITSAGLSFAEWSDGAYTIIKRIPRANIASAELQRMGRSCALIVQEASDATFHVFEFTRGMSNDCATAERALAALT